MKKNLLPILLCLLPSLIFAQSFPLRTDNPIWRLNGGGYQVSVGEADTLIDNHYWTPLNNLYSLVGLSNFYYRAESQKVYFRTDGSSTGRKEYLMYDFSLEAGDSVYIGVPATLSSVDTVLYRVYQTDTIFLGTTPRKRLQVWFSTSTSLGSLFYITDWVEGIGDLRIAFPPVFCLDQSDDAGICIGCVTCTSFDCLSTLEGVIYASGEDGFCQYFENNINRIYVNQNVTSSVQNGSSWQYAFDDLQEAIEIAESGDTIWVAQGTYLPTEFSNREIFFNLNPGIKIYGGFDGTETALHQRSWENNETILSGDIGVQGDSTDNSYHVVYTTGTDSTAILDGFTITRGYAIHPDNAYFHHLVRGGGMIVDTNEEFPDASPIIRNCNFVLNVAKHGGGLACNGVNDGYANPNLYNCRFYKNTGVIEGGGIYKTGLGYEDNPQRFEACVFEDNWAWQGGAGVMLSSACNEHFFKDCTFLNNTVISGAGAVYFYTICDKGSVSMNNCFFEGNIGTDGGALGFVDNWVDANSAEIFDFKFSECKFVKNSCTVGSGGAISIAPWHSVCEIQIYSCSFDNNHALNAGGAIQVFSSSGTESFFNINQTVFSSNYSINTPGSGAISIRGDIAAQTPPRVFSTIQNTLFYKNRGAIELVSGPGTAEMDISHCTFYDNGNFPIAKKWSANFDYQDYYTLMSLSNCIIWEPELQLKNMLYNGNPNNQNLYDYTLNNCLVSQSACDLPGGDEACNEDMVFGQSPMFVDMENGDLRVAACSPAINTGDNLYSSDILFDLDGNPRIMEDISDIGAYEREIFWMSLSEVDSVSCPGGNDGAVFFESSGDLPFSYLWEMGILADTTSNDLATGDYIFTVTDAAGCIDTFDIFIPAIDALTVDYLIQDASTFDTQDGAVLLQNISGGTPPYSWFWNTEDTTSSIENLFAGWYVLNLLDANDCDYLYNFEVSATNAINDLPADEMPELSPNPVEIGQNIQFNFPKYNVKYTIEWFDVRGLRLNNLSKTNEGNILVFDTKTLVTGLYFVKVSNKDGQFHIFRVAVN